MSLKERWLELASRLGIADAQAAFATIESSYSYDKARYHTIHHIEACLDEFSSAKHLAINPDLVEVALWFHDIVYNPRASDNEGQSATILRSVFDSPEAERLILATKHDQLPTDADSQLIVDIDLSILGKPAEEFDIYERQIRTEYAFVSEAEYRKGRAAVLAKFLAREWIYSTDHFRLKIEDQARINLARSITRLS